MERKKQDGFGNELYYMDYEEFLLWVGNKGLWCKGDEIQVKNREGQIICTTILTENGVSR